MNPSPEFFIETLPPGSKSVYRLTLPFAGGLDQLTGQIVLASSGLSSKEEVNLAIGEWLHDGRLFVPVLAARGAKPGATFVVTGGVHGDEYEGMEAIYRTFEMLDPQQMRGTMIGVPVVTLPAFWLGTRMNPLDARNLARVFPGAATGSPSEQLADAILQRVLRHATLYIDLHSAGRNYHMLTLCGYCSAGSQATRAAEAARRFGAPVIWEHPSVSPGRTVSATLELGIPSLYAEAYGGGHVRPDDISTYTLGLANLLEMLEICQPTAATPIRRQSMRVSGSGDLDQALNCTCSGMFFGCRTIGDRVKQGDDLGVVRGLDGRVLETVRVAEGGVLVLLRATPRIFAGELVAALANEDRCDDLIF